jgi:predicted glycosyltransferase
LDYLGQVLHHIKVSDNNEQPRKDSGIESESMIVNDSTVESQERLRKLLADLELTPEQTSDDMVVRTSRDQEYLDDVPPHHG